MRGLFTSDRTVSEFILITESGFEPVGLVVGSSIFHIGIQIANPGKNQEMTVLSGAVYQARELAMTRMEEEADQLGADGVESGTAIWPGGADLAPDTLDARVSSGLWPEQNLAA